jgi:hypothetical protein
MLLFYNASCLNVFITLSIEAPHEIYFYSLTSG